MWNVWPFRKHFSGGPHNTVQNHGDGRHTRNHRTRLPGVAGRDQANFLYSDGVGTGRGGYCHHSGSPLGSRRRPYRVITLREISPLYTHPKRARSLEKDRPTAWPPSSSDRIPPTSSCIIMCYINHYTRFTRIIASIIVVVIIIYHNIYDD